jgi:streptogramin lyase
MNTGEWRRSWLTTAGVITEYPVANPAAHVSGITVALDGNIWFTETFANRIGRLETDKTNRTCAGRQF